MTAFTTDYFLTSMLKPLEEQLLETVRVVHDFPKSGIAFRDITTLLNKPDLSQRVLHALCASVSPETTVIAGIESRGFLFGMAIALELQLPFVPLRKRGKLPYETHKVSYALEYGTAEIEVHKDALRAGDQVHIHDDFLATGGSALAAAALVRQSGAAVSGFSFLMAIEALGGGGILTTESPNIAILARC